MKQKILFLCTGNSCRSQMAEAFGRSYWGKDYDFYSAGTQKHGMNQRAMKVMEEIFISLSTHYSKTLDELQIRDFDFIITVCDSARESCPYLPGRKIIHLGFEDPPRLTLGMSEEEEILAVYRRIRDEIGHALSTLPQLLKEFA